MRRVDMRFQRLDLNLLVALDALLTEKSVSLAADRICLSQSATSSALGRLREYFGDDLLVLKGRQMVLTVRAEELVEPVRAVLEQVRTTIAVSPPFDPATSDRTIRIMASDFITEVLLTTAFRNLQELAPNMRFEILPMDDHPIESLDRGLCDLLLTIDYAISADHPSEILFQDDYVVVGWDKNPAMHQPMSKELYFDLGHMTVRFGQGKVSAFEDWFLRRHKKQRRVEIVAPSFLSQPGLVIGSNRIATMHRRLAMRLADYLPLKIAEAPFDIPPIREAIQWHITNNNDSAIRWVAELLIQTAQNDASLSVKQPPHFAGEVVAPVLSHRELAAQFQAETKSG
jgi:LysR family transcriptional regulator, nod-box dependent transcriptional activator